MLANNLKATHFNWLGSELFRLLLGHPYYIVILRWPVGSRRLHQNTTVIRRVTMVRTYGLFRAMSPKLGQ